MSILTKIFGNFNEKYLKGIRPLVDKINSLEPEFEKLSDQELKERSFSLKEKVKNNGSLDDILEEAFALMREAAKRTLKQRHFDVQLLGGIVLHHGRIAEMKTGEGKTLVATLAAYLNALEGKGVHIITVNDYLAKRDTVWMGQIYYFLGLTVGCINHEASYVYDPGYQNNNSQFPIPNSQTLNDDKDKERDIIGGFKVVDSFLRPVSRKEAYEADITYGTNNEFGFDYLKDNLVYELKEKVQRGFNFAIVDEVDSILIDEARTPLIISGKEEESSEKYHQFAKIISGLKEKDDYELDEKMKAANFTEAGQNKIVSILGQDPWAQDDISATHQIESALKAKALFKKDKDYIVKDGEVVIIDEFTGRFLPGRRYSGGLHQAIEAKEGVQVMPETKTYASVTFQNYFRMYKKISGMTGTALTSAEEFDKVYKLETISMPTNKPLGRRDLPDRIYKTSEGKFKAIAQEIKTRHQKGQPILVGTVSIERNEYLSKLLEMEGVKHNVLNAKQHEREGQIIAQAGKFGAVTVATNMAGRGVDIILGGNPPDLEEQKKVLEVGGLYVIGTERHEARRIDNQLRGRAGRQGDPGSSQFFVSLEDDLMRIFGGDKIKSLMDTFKVPEDQPIEAKMVSRALESAQEKIEGSNFDLRKHILEYDDIMNKHREIFYKKRDELLEKSKIQNPNYKDDIRSYMIGLLEKSGFSKNDYEKKEKEVGQENAENVIKFVCLKAFDFYWMEHLENMEHLRDSVRLRAYGQQDPLVEYKTEGHRMFKRLLETIDFAAADSFLQIKLKEPISQPKAKIQESRGDGLISTPKPSSASPVVGRNDPCPCGSGKKYKRCHGA
jgi:preprotein translocase subunit SecA